MKQIQGLPKGFCTISVERLVKASWNYKEDNDDLKEKLKNNIKRNGQIENILIRELDTGFYEVVNGNHRTDAVKELGINEVVAFNLGKITQAEAMRVAIETNELKFETNAVKLAERIKEISLEFNHEELSLTMPYNTTELENFSKLLSFDFAQFESNEEENNNSSSSSSGESNIDESEDSETDILEEGNKLLIRVSPETMALWETWKDKCSEMLDLNDEQTIFEIAIGQALAIPEKKLAKISEEYIKVEE